MAYDLGMKIALIVLILMMTRVMVIGYDVDVAHLLLGTIVGLPCAIELGKPASLPGFELWCSCGQGDLET